MATVDAGPRQVRFLWLVAMCAIAWLLLLPVSTQGASVGRCDLVVNGVALSSATSPESALEVAPRLEGAGHRALDRGWPHHRFDRVRTNHLGSLQ